MSIDEAIINTLHVIPGDKCNKDGTFKMLKEDVKSHIEYYTGSECCDLIKIEREIFLKDAIKERKSE